MVVVVGLDEAVVRQVPGFAVSDELIERGEDLRLVFEQIDDLHRRTGAVVVVDFRGAAGEQGPFVDAEVGPFPIEDVHAHPAEGGSVVGKGAVADRWTGYRGKPAVEDGELRCQAGDHRELVRREVVHDLVGVLDVPLLLVVAPDESAHGGLAVRRLVAVENLRVDAGKMVVGVGVELALIIRLGRDLDPLSLGILVALVPRQTIDGGVLLLQRPEHVVERAVFHHQDHDMLELIQSL